MAYTIDGTSLPASSLFEGRLFYDNNQITTSQGLLVYYDDTNDRWLTVQEYTGIISSTSRTTDGIFDDSILWVGDARGIVISRIAFRSVVYTTNTGAAYWDVTVKSYKMDGTTTDIYTFDTSGDSVGVFTDHDSLPDTATPANYGGFHVSCVKTGSPGQIYVYPTIYYRLIVT